MLTRGATAGFSLIELMITVAVFALLAVLAAPSLHLYSENVKILVNAEAFYAAVQQARTEAIRRNTPVELILTSAVASSQSADTTALATSGPNWIVRQPPPTAESNAYLFIAAKDGAEGGGRASQDTSVLIDASSATVRFNPNGALASASVSVDFSSRHAACSPAGGARCMRVVAAAGGQVRLCDPAVAGGGDTRAC
ncbi:Type II transport protein GspH [Xylophilus ampelinus]|nr:Type II transport protein GspH [Xylophilus ampelinus]